MIEVKIFGLDPYESSQEQIEKTSFKLRSSGWTVCQKITDDRSHWTEPRAEPFFSIPPANYETKNKPTYLVCSRMVQDNGDRK
jgi:hypothetical protein